MSQFNFINDMNNLLNLDGELRNQSKPRWQRKEMDLSKLSVSYNNSYAAISSANTTTGGNKSPNKSIAEGGAKKKTPNDKKKSPGKSLEIF